MKLLFIILLFSSCLHSKKATLTGYDKDRMILVTSDTTRHGIFLLVSYDTISYGSHSKGKVGDKYKVKFIGNKVVRIKKY